ncbi:MAG: TRAP transporter substrate-binding protein [Chloroflexota bacterium]
MLRFGCPVAESTTQVQAMKRFGDELGKLSGGQFKVEVYPSNQLGGLREMMENTQLGTQQMALVTPAVAAPFVKTLDVMTLLFLSTSIEKVYAAVDGDFGKRLDADAQKAGLKILGWWYAAPRQFCNNRRPINTPDDLSGLKIRVINSPVWVKSITALGANPVAMDFGEIYSALQQNVIDGYENLATDVYRGKFYEVIKYMSMSYHLYDVFTVFINKKLFDGFTPDQQKMVGEAIRTATTWQRPAQAADIEESMTQLRKLIAVNDISAQNLALFKEKVRPVYSQFEQDLGKDLIAEAIKVLS